MNLHSSKASHSADPPIAPAPERAAGSRAPGSTAVCFFLPDEEDLDRLASLGPEEDWREFVVGERAWILQTYLWLVRQGRPAFLTAHPPEQGLVVFHAKHKRALRHYCRSWHQLCLVGVRGDLKPALVADFEVVQNPIAADRRRTFFVPHWPQAGLIPRDPSRGATVRNVGFKGWLENLHPDLRSEEWRRALARRGVHWIGDALEFRRSQARHGGLLWNDYRELDVLVALRPQARGLYASKPATKLVNAWRAGVPAVLGAESAYCALRRSPLDYIEVTSAEEARAAVQRLAEDRSLYRAMVERGRQRAVEVSFEAIAERWAELLYCELPERALELRDRPARRLPLALRVACRRLAGLAAPAGLRRADQGRSRARRSRAQAESTSGTNRMSRTR